MRESLERLWQAEKDFPTFQGVVTHPGYVPEPHREQYTAQIFEWARTHARHLWPAWLVEFMATYRPTARANP